MLIAAAASLLSVVVIVIVTFVVNWSMVQERDKKKDLRRVIYDINNTNESAIKLDVAQNDVLQQLNKGLDNVHADMTRATLRINALNTDLIATGNNLSKLASTTERNISEVSSTHASDMNMMNNRFMTLSNNTIVLQTDIGNVRNSVTTLQTDVTNVRNDVGSVINSVNLLQGDFSNVKNNYANKQDLARQITSGLVTTGAISYPGSNIVFTPGGNSALQTRIDNLGNMYVAASQTVAGNQFVRGGNLGIGSIWNVQSTTGGLQVGQSGATTPKTLFGNDGSISTGNVTGSNVSLPINGKLNIGTGVVDFDNLSGSLRMSKFKSTNATLDSLTMGGGSIAYEGLSNAFKTDSNMIMNNAYPKNIYLQPTGVIGFGSNNLFYSTSKGAIATNRFQTSNAFVNTGGSLCIGNTCITESNLMKVLRL